MKIFFKKVLTNAYNTFIIIIVKNKKTKSADKDRKTEKRENNMKKLETILKAVETVDAIETLRNHLTLDEAIEYFESDDIIREEIKRKQLLSMLVFDELKKALDKKDKFTLKLDANIEFSKMHNNCKYLVDYYSLLDSDNKRVVQIYVTTTKDNVYFKICTSCRNNVRNTFEDNMESLQFEILRDKKTNRAKTTQRCNVSYDEVVNVVKNVIAVLNNQYKNDEE